MRERAVLLVSSLHSLWKAWKRDGNRAHFLS